MALDTPEPTPTTQYAFRNRTRKSLQPEPSKSVPSSSPPSVAAASKSVYPKTRRHSTIPTSVISPPGEQQNSGKPDSEEELEPLVSDSEEDSQISDYTDEEGKYKYKKKAAKGKGKPAAGGSRRASASSVKKEPSGGKGTKLMKVPLATAKYTKPAAHVGVRQAIPLSKSASSSKSPGEYSTSPTTSSDNLPYLTYYFKNLSTVLEKSMVEATRDESRQRASEATVETVVQSLAGDATRFDAFCLTMNRYSAFCTSVALPAYPITIAKVAIHLSRVLPNHIGTYFRRYVPSSIPTAPIPGGIPLAPGEGDSVTPQLLRSWCEVLAVCQTATKRIWLDVMEDKIPEGLLTEPALEEIFRELEVGKVESEEGKTQKSTRKREELSNTDAIIIPWKDAEVEDAPQKKKTKWSKGGLSVVGPEVKSPSPPRSGIENAPRHTAGAGILGSPSLIERSSIVPGRPKSPVVEPWQRYASSTAPPATSIFAAPSLHGRAGVPLSHGITSTTVRSYPGKHHTSSSSMDQKQHQAMLEEYQRRAAEQELSKEQQYQVRGGLPNHNQATMSSQSSQYLPFQSNQQSQAIARDGRLNETGKNTLVSNSTGRLAIDTSSQALGTQVSPIAYSARQSGQYSSGSIPAQSPYYPPQQYRSSSAVGAYYRPPNGGFTSSDSTSSHQHLASTSSNQYESNDSRNHPRNHNNSPSSYQYYPGIPSEGYAAYTSRMTGSAPSPYSQSNAYRSLPTTFGTPTKQNISQGQSYYPSHPNQTQPPLIHSASSGVPLTRQYRQESFSQYQQSPTSASTMTSHYPSSNLAAYSIGSSLPVNESTGSNSPSTYTGESKYFGVAEAAVGNQGNFAGESRKLGVSGIEGGAADPQSSTIGERGEGQRSARGSLPLEEQTSNARGGEEEGALGEVSSGSNSVAREV